MGAETVLCYNIGESRLAATVAQLVEQLIRNQ